MRGAGSQPNRGRLAHGRAGDTVIASTTRNAPTRSCERILDTQPPFDQLAGL